MSVFALARRLQRLLAVGERDGWWVGEDEGFIDPARLAQLVAAPGNHRVFRTERLRPRSHAAVTFLVDTSGSMKRQGPATVATLVDTLTRALDLAGATTEVLGFTTRSWNGGESLREWRRAGEPLAPGRLAEVLHVVYKDATTPWRRARHSIAAMMRTEHYRESIDGEAIAWAHRRLAVRPEPRKLLVVIGDGAPMEAATINANDEHYLERHRRSIVAAIERDSAVTIGSISVDRPVEAVFARSAQVDLSGTLTLADYRVVERLAGHDSAN